MQIVSEKERKIKMDKKELESNLSKVSKMLNSKDADNIINQIKKNNNIN